MHGTFNILRKFYDASTTVDDQKHLWRQLFREKIVSLVSAPRKKQLKINWIWSDLYSHIADMAQIIEGTCSSTKNDDP